MRVSVCLEDWCKMHVDILGKFGLKINFDQLELVSSGPKQFKKPFRQNENGNAIQHISYPYRQSHSHSHGRQFWSKVLE